MQLVDRRTYRAKKPGNCNGYVNDRTIVYINSEWKTLRYDGPGVPNGRHRPKVSFETFEKWASHDITDQLPAGEYMTWDQYLQNKKNEKMGIG
jgi:hypothetical protein